MLPVGAVMTFVLWAFFMVVYKPEKARIPGLREKVKTLSVAQGPITAREIISLAIVFLAIALLSIRALSPADSPLRQLDKSAVILCSTILFFVFRILDLKDLEKIPWNIILLFGGAMSIGFCLWQTGAAKWLALHWLVMFQNAPWLLFVLGMAFFVLIMTNFIMNVAAIAISLPVSLVIAPYLGVSGEVVMYAALVTAGMPFLCLVGAAPNAIAYESKQFTSGEFFKIGIPASAILMVVVGLFVYFVWPLMGMPVRI
jgi:sodium-dependent dicarboxylate transporter 2/3/5